MKNSYKLGLAAIAASLALVGCGGGSSSTPAGDVAGGVSGAESSVSGKFIDAAVQGLYYFTTTQEGYTDENGTYECLPGEQVTFSVGNLELGTAECGTLITPYTIGTPNSPHALNIAELLQNLDVNKSNTDTIDVSNLKDFNFSSDVNLSDTFNFQQDILDTHEIEALLDTEDTTVITQAEAKTALDSNVAAAETDLETTLTTFVTGNTFTISGAGIPSGMALSFETDGTFIDYDPEDFGTNNTNCIGSWSITAYNMVEVTGGCAMTFKFIGTPEDGVVVDVNVTDEVASGELFTGSLTTVGKDLKTFVTGKDFDFDEQSEPGVDFWIWFGANADYWDSDAVDTQDQCSGKWLAIADDTIASPECGVKFQFPAVLEDGMTISITVQDPGQSAETFTGTLTEYIAATTGTIAKRK